MARVAVVTGGTRGIGAAVSKALKAAGCQVAATYHANDEAAAKFKAETGVHVYKWNVANYDECVAGLAKVAAGPRPGRHSGQQCGHHQGRDVPQDDPGPMVRRHQHQPQFPLQHVPAGHRGHARARVRPHHQHLVDQRPEGADGPGQLFGREGRRSRLHQGARAGERQQGRHRQRDLPRLYRHRNGHGRAEGRARKSRSCPRFRCAASASRKKSPAASFSSPPTTPASSPARPCPPTAGKIMA